MSLTSIINVDNIRARNQGDLQLLPSLNNNPALKVSKDGSVSITRNLVIPTSAPSADQLTNGSIWLS